MSGTNRTFKNILLSKISEDSLLRILRVGLLQIISLSSVLIFSIILSPETYSEYLMYLVYYNFPLIFLPSIFLMSKRIEKKPFEIEIPILIFIAFASLFLTLISKRLFSFQYLGLAIGISLYGYLTNELNLICRKLSRLKIYILTNFLLSLPPFLASIILFFFNTDYLKNIIGIQLILALILLIIVLKILKNNKLILFNWRLKSKIKGLKLHSKIMGNITYTLLANGSGYIFQLLIRTGFTSLAISNNNNLYNLIMGIVQRIHLVYDSVAEKYFSSKERPQKNTVFDFILPGTLLLILLFAFYTNLFTLKLVSITSLIYLFQAFSSRYHHFLLGNQLFKKINRIYFFALISQAIILFYLKSETIGLFLNALLVYLLIFILFKISTNEKSNNRNYHSL